MTICSNGRSASASRKSSESPVRAVLCQPLRLTTPAAPPPLPLDDGREHRPRRRSPTPEARTIVCSGSWDFAFRISALLGRDVEQGLAGEAAHLGVLIAGGDGEGVEGQRGIGAESADRFGSSLTDAAIRMG